MLGDCVGDSGRSPRERGFGADVDDAAVFLGEHVWCHSPHEGKWGGEVDAHDTGVFCVGEVVGGGEGVNYAGVIDQNIDCASGGSDHCGKDNANTENLPAY